MKYSLRTVCTDGHIQTMTDFSAHVRSVRPSDHETLFRTGSLPDALVEEMSVVRLLMMYHSVNTAIKYRPSRTAIRQPREMRKRLLSAIERKASAGSDKYTVRLRAIIDHVWKGTV